MEGWKRDGRKDVVMVDLEALVPKDHLLRKIEQVMDYDWLYEHLAPYYCHDSDRPGTDPVVLIKMVLIQHLFGIPSLRQTYRETQVNNAYRWFLGYSLLDNIPHFATVSYAFGSLNHGQCPWFSRGTIKTAPLGGAARKGFTVGRPFRRALRRRQQHALIGLVHATRFTGGHDYSYLYISCSVLRADI